MKRFFLFLVSLLVGLVLFSWVTKIVGVGGIKIALFLFFSWQGLLLLALNFLIAYVATLRWQEILKKRGKLLPFSELLKSYLAGFSLNYFLPQIALAGEVARAQILKERSLVSFEKALASVIIDRLLELAFILLLVFPGVFIFLSQVGLLPRNLSLIVFGFLFVLASGIGFFFFKAARRESVLKLLRVKKAGLFRVEEEIFQFFQARALSKKALCLSFLRALLLFLRTWLLIFFLGEAAGLAIIWPAFSFAWIGTTLPISADIGSHEAIQAFVFQALGLGASKGAAFAMIIRGIEVAVSLPGLFFLFRFGLRLFETKLFSRIETFFGKNEKSGDSKNI